MTRTERQYPYVIIALQNVNVNVNAGRLSAAKSMIYEILVKAFMSYYGYEVAELMPCKLSVLSFRQYQKLQ